MRLRMTLTAALGALLPSAALPASTAAAATGDFVYHSTQQPPPARHGRQSAPARPTARSAATGASAAVAVSCSAISTVNTSARYLSFPRLRGVS